MAGLFRFDFYPRDWIVGTRNLSHAAKGVYIDILSAIYARGAPIPCDETDLCRLTGCKTARSLRPLLAELIEKTKIRVVDNHLVNDRALEEIDKFERRKGQSSDGGKARSAQVRGELDANLGRTSDETVAHIEQNQQHSFSLLPSPSPSKTLPPSEAASAAPVDPKKSLYDFGKEVLGKGTGGLVRKILDRHAGDIDGAMHTLRLAAGKSEPREYIGAILRGDSRPETDWAAEYRRMGVTD